MPDAPVSEPHASTTCAFCRIIRGEDQASMVFEDSLSLAFLDHRPLFPGHCLLVPKAHYATLANLPAPLVGPLFQNAQLLEQAIEEGLEADGTFVAINNRVSQSVPMCISTSCPVIARMVSKASFGPDNATRMRQPFGRCKKPCVLPLPGSDLVSSPAVAERSARAICEQNGWLGIPSPMSSQQQRSTALMVQ